WQQHSVTTEGYLLSGAYRHSECVGGKAVTVEYGAGGYFLRPAGAVSGGPDAGSRECAVWLLRKNGRASVSTLRGCNETSRVTGYLRTSLDETGDARAELHQLLQGRRRHFLDLLVPVAGGLDEPQHVADPLLGDRVGLLLARDVLGAF